MKVSRNGPERRSGKRNPERRSGKRNPERRSGKRLREDSLLFVCEQQFKPNHKVLKPFSVVIVRGPHIFQAVRRAEELSLRLGFR